MALLLPHSIFIHVPKTGGSWVRKAIAHAGIPHTELLCRRSTRLGSLLFPAANGKRSWNHNCTHDGLRDIDPGDRFTFGFVRHPLSFYQSYWRHKIRIGWDTENRFDRLNQAPDFSTFVENTLAFRWLNGMEFSIEGIYSGCLEHSGRTVDFIGKQESLVEDLIRALRLAGEAFDEQKLYSTTVENSTEDDEELRRRSIFPPNLEARVLERERETLRKYNYDARQTLQTGSLVGSPQRVHSVNILEGCKV